MKTKSMPYKKISQVFGAIDSPVRIQILLALTNGEACVCHLEASLGLRQAYISQQLMDLRKHGLVSSRRDGKFIYHRIKKPEVLELVRLAAEMNGIPENTLEADAPNACACPNCASTEQNQGVNPAQATQTPIQET